jgi:pyruvate dehydrogenase (quinone)
VAERLKAGVAKALLGKAVVPDDLPFVTGSIGLLGTKPSWDLMKGCDSLLMVGSSFPYSEFLPKPGAARGVQIDIDGSRLSLRYPMEVNMVGDSATTLRALLPMLQQKTDTSWPREIESGLKSWWNTLRARAMDSADPLNPQRVFWELSPRLPDNAIITADSGSVANWYARDLKMRRGMKASLSGGLASLGAGTPYAVAGKMVLSGSNRDRLHGRWGDADEWPQLKILEAMVQSAAHRSCVEQPRPQPGDLGGARANGRRQDGIDTSHSGFPISQVCRVDWTKGHLRR